MNKRFIKASLLSLFLGLGVFTFAQNTQATIDQQWQHADYKTNKKAGVSSEKAYTELVAGKTQAPIVVAVIDSGTESFHEDLKMNLWTNTDEIPGNGIDDDNNGYIDDMHGWSFIGGANGDVAQDNLEFTRIYKDLKEKYGARLASEIGPADKAEYDKYIDFKKQFEERLANAKAEKQQFDSFNEIYSLANNTMANLLGKKDYTLEELKALNVTDPTNQQFKALMVQMKELKMDEQIPDWKKHVEESVKYSYNLDFDPRSVVGDNYADPNERYYGNNHIDGPESDHGTHVGGIIGAAYNGIGMDGICKTAQLMIIRCVPAGDERDKDVANAIRYAVDNGAKIINMSFGKAYSPYKSVVDEAVKYAESKGVLLIHAAGNDNKDLDVSDNFPTKKYSDGGECSTWIEVGASGPELKTLAAGFSNYGKTSVDIFSPGVDIYSTVPGNKYKENSGTSMAAPVLAGVAATVWSFYPNLTAQQVKEILLESGVNYGKKKVVKPGEKKKKVKFSTLSRTGKVVNLYNALQLAATKS